MSTSPSVSGGPFSAFFLIGSAADASAGRAGDRVTLGDPGGRRLMTPTERDGPSMWSPARAVWFRATIASQARGDCSSTRRIFRSLVFLPLVPSSYVTVTGRPRLFGRVALAAGRSSQLFGRRWEGRPGFRRLTCCPYSTPEGDGSRRSNRYRSGSYRRTPAEEDSPNRE